MTNADPPGLEADDMAAARQSRALTHLAEETEDVAAGLHNFRDRLPRYATVVTAVLGELFAISALLREIDQAQQDQHYAPSFYRIRDDIGLLIPSLQLTLDKAFTMFERTSDRSHQVAWEDLQYQMEQVEDLSLHDRLSCYHDFLRAQRDIIRGHQPPPSLRNMRSDLNTLCSAQQVNNLRPAGRAIPDSCK